HASACNVIKCIFSVPKQQFRILVHPPEYDNTQSLIPQAFAAIHNFIHIHDPLEIEDFPDQRDLDPGTDVGELALRPPRAAERATASAKHDAIVAAMWIQYRETLAERGQF
ncbi:hypothetical protein JB92DRAFT_2713567, partial [Gautieria morchelliformis]